MLAAAIPLLASAEAVAAIGASLRSRLHDNVLERELAVRLDAVLDALGVLDVVDELSEREIAGLLALIDSYLLQAADHVVIPDRANWDHRNPSILMAQGHLSSLLAPIFEQFVLPSLGGGLTARLATPGASFLDVGTGVGAFAVAMCRVWPALRVVGIEPWEPALELARENVAAAGLGTRVDLRPTAAERLRDADEHDLAWVPTFFISGNVLERVIETVHCALRPDGYAIFGLYVRSDDPLATTLADLRTVRHGGVLLTPQDMAALLKRSGFADVDILFDVAWRTPVLFVAGRRRASAAAR